MDFNKIFDMKRYILNMIMLIAGLSLASCSFLEREPDFVTPDYYYKTEAEMQKALNGVYNRLIDTNGRMYSKGLFGFFVLSDEFSYTNNFLENNIRHGSFDAADLDIGRLWEILYEGVSRANFLIASFNDTVPEEKSRKAILGEALFMRGYYYFLLTTCFGEVPLKLTPTVNPDEEYLAKSSLEAVYHQIIDDMTRAEGLVLEIDELGSNERISKTGVQAILARVYLKMAGEPLTPKEERYSEKAMKYYEQALIYANMVISSGKHSLNSDYAQIFINQIQNVNEPKEVLWEVGMYGNKIGAEDLAGSVGVENGVLCRDEKFGYSGGPMTAQKKLFDAFETADLRRDWSIADHQWNYDSKNDVRKKIDLSDESNPNNLWKRNPGKWRREYETGNKAQLYTATNFPLMRYSDVLLMKAEALNALQGPVEDAYNAVNQVRRRAYGKPMDTPDASCDIRLGLDRDEFQQEIEDERFREFCFEGIRKWDLIRWGVYVSTMRQLASDVTSFVTNKNNKVDQVYLYCARAGNKTTDRNVLFPIPNTELTVNKKMTQNPGW